MLFVLIGGVATLRADNSAADMAARNGQLKQQIQTDYNEVLKLQAQARRQKDIIKLNCVNDKLVQIKALMNFADASRDQIEAGGSTGGSVDEKYGLRQTASSIHDLRQQAGACLGEVELSNEESSSYTHPNFPDDPTVIPFDTYVEPPVYASPFN